MIVCHCWKLNDRELRQAIEGGAHSIEELGCATGAGTCCGGCHPTLEELVTSHGPKRSLVILPEAS